MAARACRPAVGGAMMAPIGPFPTWAAGTPQFEFPAEAEYTSYSK
jgi:hypothetical protein